MNLKIFKEIFSNVYVIVLIIALVLSFVSINWNPFAHGVAIKGVIANSPASVAGISQPDSSAQPRNLEVITSIYNSKIGDHDIYNMTQFMSYVLKLNFSDTVRIFTNKNPLGYVLNLSNWENQTDSSNITQIEQEDSNILGLNLINAPTSNIRLGLDLQGGARIIVSPQENISTQTLNNIVSNLRERFNVYGLTDVNVMTASDLNGKNYIVVEMAGASVQQLESLISQQGKFEAKIGNYTVFTGGKKDIAAICNDPTCSYLPSPFPPYNGNCLLQNNNSYVCGYNFQITISQNAANKMANLTKRMVIVPGTSHLNQTIDFYLDGKKVESLQIDKGLKGKAILQPSLSGFGSGNTKKNAYIAALGNMKKMKTILSTGSLPTKLNVDQVENISSTQGSNFIKNVLLLAFIAILAVTIVVSSRYKTKQTLIPIVITMISELFILLGVAAFVKWNLDLAAIAGIIIAIGGGVDDQIVIIDEVLSKDKKSKFVSLIDRVKNAFFIIMGSYFTLVVAMIPLFSAGVGLLKGFAFTTIVGVSIGVFITRPTFARIIEIFVKHKND